VCDEKGRMNGFRLIAVYKKIQPADFAFFQASNSLPIIHGLLRFFFEISLYIRDE